MLAGWYWPILRWPLIELEFPNTFLISYAAQSRFGRVLRIITACLPVGSGYKFANSLTYYTLKADYLSIDHNLTALNMSQKFLFISKTACYSNLIF